MSDDKMPFHEQVYHAVRDSQLAARHRELNKFQSTGTYAPNSHPACIGAILGLTYFAFHFANEMDSFGMIIGVPVGGILVGGILGIIVSKAWRLTKAAPVMLYRGIKMLIKGIPREPPV